MAEHFIGSMPDRKYEQENEVLNLRIVFSMKYGYVVTDRLRQNEDSQGWHQSKMGYRCQSLLEAVNVVAGQAVALAEYQQKLDRIDMPEGEIRDRCDQIIRMLLGI